LPSAAASTATSAGAPAAVHRTVEERDALPINRELSLLAFNHRVLALAQDPAVPLLERLRFLCIVSSNLDEFFEIRVAGLREQLRVKAPMVGTTLHELKTHIGEIGLGAQALVAAMYRTLNEQILPALTASGVRMLRSAERNAAQRAWVADYFQREIRPLLTPIGLDPAHPFPQVVNKSLNFIVELSGRDAFGRETSVAIVKAPRVVPRVIRMPPEVASAENTFVLLSSVIHAHLHELFSGRDVINYSQFRVTRDADLWIDEEEVKNLRQALEGELPQRQFGLAVRLEVAAHCPQHLATFLLQQFELQDFDLYRCEGPVNLARMSALIEQVDVDKLEYPPFLPGMPGRLRDAPDLFAAIRQHDILLHHPYQSFEPVVEFIRKATDDPDVVAIKQTVYRTGVNSVLMEALIDAARRGKEVTVVVELMARFDEEANINWAERLEQTGAQVVYGVFGLKTHAKLALLLRREKDATGESRLQPYAHLGTGNYHPRTARTYTDFGLLTAHPEICADVQEVFLHITSLAKANRLKRLWLAPFTMHRHLLEAIRRETRHAREGKRARIVAKMNALLEEAVIKALYAASQAGVSIDLIVRGACALRPGVKGVSDNIRVRSIVGRFLEHSRIWWFDNNGADDVYLSSADWMGRNLFRRIEVAFPVLDPALKVRVIDEGLKPYLGDSRDAWDLDADASYARAKPRPRTQPSSAQAELLERMADKAGADS
jgi:polyphosphate kinase